MKYRDRLKVKMVLEDGFKEGFMEYIDHFDRFEDAQDHCFHYLLGQNIKLSPLVQLMLEYLDVQTLLETTKFKTPPFIPKIFANRKRIRIQIVPVIRLLLMMKNAIKIIFKYIVCMKKHLLITICKLN